MTNRFLEIDEIIINDDILTTNFTCDLKKCKGACCTMESNMGAPLEENEIGEIKNVLDVVFDYLPNESKKAILKSGFWEEKFDTLMTKSINNRDCVFVYYENDVAKCAIEKAYFDEKIKFRKPISCHLFPIRVADLGGKILRYEEYDDCRGALELGEKTQISVLDFCGDALKRAFGINWFNQLKKSAEL